MSVATRWANPEILRWARERLNMTFEQVQQEAKKLSRRAYAPVTAQQVQDWENGKNEPDITHLETLAEIYVCPVGYFFFEATPSERLPMNFRGIAKDAKQLESVSLRTLRKFSDLAHWTVEFLRNSGQSWHVGIRPGQVALRRDTVEALARDYRQRFGWSDEQPRRFAGKSRKGFREAFRWWRRTIESQGIFCFEMPLDPKEVRGAALWCEGYPFILVNHQDFEAAAGRIFTLLHEYAHLISATEGVVCDFREVHRNNNPEPLVNRFAARMLISPEEMQDRLHELGETGRRGDWPDSLLDKIRKPFFASRDVVAILLRELNLAPSDFYDRKRQQWESKTPGGRRGRRPPLNEQKLQEVGHSLARVLAQLASQPTFPWMDASSILGMKVEKAEAFLKWVQEHAQ